MTDGPARAESAAEPRFGWARRCCATARKFSACRRQWSASRTPTASTSTMYTCSNAIFANAVENGRRVETKLKFIPGSTIHFGRIAGINQLSREIACGGISISGLRPPAFDRRHPLYTPAGAHDFLRRRQRLLQLSVRRLGIRCACRAGLRHCIAGFSKPYRPARRLKIHHKSASSALVACCAVALFSLGLGDSLDKIIIGSIIRLVPGVALTTSIRDFLNGDYLSGTIRMIDAFLIGGCIAIGVGAVVMLYFNFAGGAPLL